MIDSSEISIVIQGPIYKDSTSLVCKKMRELFPNAEIILSTWEGSNLTDLDYDIVLLNKDPGGTLLFKDQKLLNNLNRQILSSSNGIKKATRKYCLKWRTDLLLKDDKFLQHFDKYPERNPKWKFFKKRVLVHYPTLPYIYPLSPTDISCFGLTEDVLTYWNLPLQPKEEANYFMDHPFPQDTLIDYQPVITKRGSEGYIWYNVLKKFEDKFGKVNSDWGFELNKELLDLSELSIVNNLQVVERNDFDFEALEHPYLLRAEKTFVTEDLYQYWYKKWCLKSVPVYDIDYYILKPIKQIKYKFKYFIPLKKCLKCLKKLRFIKAYQAFMHYKRLFYNETYLDKS